MQCCLPVSGLTEMALCCAVCLCCLLAARRGHVEEWILSSTHPSFTSLRSPIPPVLSVPSGGQGQEGWQDLKKESHRKLAVFKSAEGDGQSLWQKVQFKKRATRCRGELYQRRQTSSVGPRGITLKNPHSCSPLPLNHPATLSHSSTGCLSLSASHFLITPKSRITHQTHTHAHTSLWTAVSLSEISNLLPLPTSTYSSSLQLLSFMSIIRGKTIVYRL